MISVSGLNKRFKLYRKPSDRLREVIFRRAFHHAHDAVRDVSFVVHGGETLGIIGKNGAGKSTLLKLLTGVLQADSGEVHIDGKITGLLELGTGFDTEQTGIQNILSNGLLLGMTVDEIDARRQDIIAFSELGDYIEEPLRTYSSGMVMRLAFSIAIHAEPQCFVVDEALSVGDGHFQQKCMRRIKDFRAGGGSIIFVSHDLNAVKMLCDRVLVLDAGVAVFAGDAEHAVNHYNQLMAELDEPMLRTVDAGSRAGGYGDGRAAITAATLRGQDSNSEVVSSGEATSIAIDISAREDISELTIGIMIRDRFGQDVYGTNTCHLGQTIDIAAGQVKRAIFTLDMDIAPGKYTLTAALHSDEHHAENCYHWWDNLLGFEVAGIRGPVFSGLCRLQPGFAVQDLPLSEVRQGD